MEINYVFSVKFSPTDTLRLFFTRNHSWLLYLSNKLFYSIFFHLKTNWITTTTLENLNKRKVKFKFLKIEDVFGKTK